MREIKYRAWNKKTKKFVYTGIDYVIYKNHMCENNYGDFIRLNYLEEPEQFTGVPDKNGVEIYEGDILQYDYEIRIKGIVKWIDDEVLFSIHYESGKYGLFAGEDISLFEVIGNVHEEV